VCASALAGALLLAGWGADQAVATSLANAARPSRLPLVVACWEKAFEAGPTHNSFVATVDFVVAEQSSRIRDAKVRSLNAAVDGESESPLDPGAEAPFRACIEDALNHSSFPKAADKDGPGFSTSHDLRVSGFRIAFVDASAKRRAIASAHQANVLIGPRADRCQGLYSHEPPRDASALYAEISAAEGHAAWLKDQDQADERAREFQKAYDAQLELIERLSSDVGRPGVPDVNRGKTQRALDEARARLVKMGARIGCKPR